MTPAPASAEAGAAPRRSISAVTTLSFADAFRFLSLVIAPTWAKGIFLRRPRVLRLAERWQVDRKAVRIMQRLRRKHGESALLVRAPGRCYVVPLAISDVRCVLEGAPDPFAPASREKRAALSRFEPHVSLITRGPARVMRRRFNDEALESGQAAHHLAASFLASVREEAARLVQALSDDAAPTSATLSSTTPTSTTLTSTTLIWPMFTRAWFAAVRRIVLGHRARDDRGLTESLARLRGRANWVYISRARDQERAKYFSRLAVHVACADPDSLAGAVAHRRDGEQPLDQITHWLFAFDAGAITAFRALALFASHPQELARAAPDLAAWREGRPDLPQLRGGFLDAVRLWPTTPLILRETTAMTHWGAAVPDGSGVVIFAPFFHRDDERLAVADRFAPELWRARDPADALPFVPFSAGPAACPGRHLVALIGAAWLAALLESGRFELLHPHNFGPGAPLPATLDHFSIALRYSAIR